ncbi:MAG: hypothetical protein H0W45_00785 [Acidobacteria bacterium]|nr:hypothetical protein [Acidobacteriota bacterium]
MKTSDILPKELALLPGALGDRDAAFLLLEKACVERDPNLPFIAVSPDYDDLRSDPRFTDLLRRVGLPQ